MHRVEAKFIPTRLARQRESCVGPCIKAGESPPQSVQARMFQFIHPAHDHMLHEARKPLEDAGAVCMAKAHHIFRREEKVRGPSGSNMGLRVRQRARRGPRLRSNAYVHECILPIVPHLEDGLSQASCRPC